MDDALLIVNQLCNVVVDQLILDSTHHVGVSQYILNQPCSVAIDKPTLDRLPYVVIILTGLVLVTYCV